MPRGAAVEAKGSGQRSSSKRAAVDLPSRQSKRTKGPRKSYIEADSEEDDVVRKDDQSDDASEFAELSASEDEADSNSEDNVHSSDEERPPSKHTRGRQTKSRVIQSGTKSKELWKPGAKLELGTQVIIKRPKARDEGNTSYADDTIHPNTMLFLQDLKKHNDRAWLKAHDADYRASLQDFNSFTESLSDRVIAADDTIPELPVKDVVFRIYRDVRFSKDPTPYKTYFSAAWSRTGRKGPYAAYYVQIQPNGGSFVADVTSKYQTVIATIIDKHHGGGLWQPEAPAIAKLRRDIDQKPHKIKRVLTEAGLRRAFFGNIPNDENRAVKAFVNQTSNVSNALKKHPKGYDASHKNIQLLRLRNFTVGTKLVDEDVVGAKGLERIAELVGCMVPFVTYLNSVVMPDEDNDSSSSNNTSDEEDDEEAQTEGD